jgi:ubiquinone/menaquinone biosynthesis C-methylase UbiE
MILSTISKILEILFWIILILIGYQILIRVVRKIWHFPAPAFIGFFLDSNRRRVLQPPEKLIAESGIKEGMRVLEIGCGSGAFTTYIAHAVGPEGKVEALDIQPKMLKQLENKLSLPKNSNIKNIELHQASAYELPFEDEEIDLISMVTVLPEIPDQQKALLECKRVLKPKGILAISELLPDPDYPLPRTTIRRGEKAGFMVSEVFPGFWTYTVRFKKP